MYWICKSSYLKKRKTFKIQSIHMKKLKQGHAQFYKCLSILFCSLCILVHLQTFVEFDVNLFRNYFFVQKLSLLLWQELKWQKISICKCDFFPSEQGNYLLFELPPVMFISLSKLRIKHQQSFLMVSNKSRRTK